MLRDVCSWYALSVVVVLFVGLPAADAAYLSFTMDFEFSGGTAPAGINPWVTILIEDDTADNTVVLSITNTNLVDREFTTGVYLNLVDTMSTDDLFFTNNGQIGSFSLPTIHTGSNDFKADGDGYYDIYLAFSTSKKNRFEVGESVAYMVTGPEGFGAASFKAMSAPGGGHRPYLAAARVQGIGANASESGWLAPATAVPEPATIGLLLAGTTGILARRGRNREIGCIK
jgi:hypothetical protein